MQSHLEEIYQTLSKANDLLKTIPELCLEAEEMIRLSGLETTDFMHEIEFLDLDEVRSIEIVQEMKAMRQNRRVAKDNQVVFLILKEFFEKNNTFIRRLDDTTKSIAKSIESRKNRVYEPRVRLEMGKIYANKAMDPAYQETIAHLEVSAEEQPILN